MKIEYFNLNQNKEIVISLENEEMLFRDLSLENAHEENLPCDWQLISYTKKQPQLYINSYFNQAGNCQEIVLKDSVIGGVKRVIYLDDDQNVICDFIEEPHKRIPYKKILYAAHGNPFCVFGQKGDIPLKVYITMEHLYEGDVMIHDDFDVFDNKILTDEEIISYMENNNKYKQILDREAYNKDSLMGFVIKVNEGLEDKIRNCTKKTKIKEM